MAARKRTYQTDTTREKIRTTQLVNRLQKFALGPDKDETPIELSQAQIKAIDILLSKTLPALTQADIHDSRQEETKTYEEIRLELIREHGEPLALLLLKEITQGQYLTMMQAELGKQTASNKQIGIEQNEHGETGKDVILAHPHAVETIQ